MFSFFWVFTAQINFDIFISNLPTFFFQTRMQSFWIPPSFTSGANYFCLKDAWPSSLSKRRCSSPDTLSTYETGKTKNYHPSNRDYLAHCLECFFCLSGTNLSPLLLRRSSRARTKPSTKWGTTAGSRWARIPDPPSTRSPTWVLFLFSRTLSAAAAWADSNKPALTDKLTRRKIIRKQIIFFWALEIQICGIAPLQLV